MKFHATYVEELKPGRGGSMKLVGQVPDGARVPHIKVRITPEEVAMMEQYSTMRPAPVRNVFPEKRGGETLGVIEFTSTKDPVAVKDGSTFTMKDKREGYEAELAEGDTLAFSKYTPPKSGVIGLMSLADA